MSWTYWFSPSRIFMPKGKSERMVRNDRVWGRVSCWLIGSWIFRPCVCPSRSLCDVMCAAYSTWHFTLATLYRYLTQKNLAPIFTFLTIKAMHCAVHGSEINQLSWPEPRAWCISIKYINSRTTPRLMMKLHFFSLHLLLSGSCQLRVNLEMHSVVSATV